MFELVIDLYYKLAYNKMVSVHKTIMHTIIDGGI